MITTLFDLPHHKNFVIVQVLFAKGFD